MKHALPKLRLGATSFLVREDYIPAVRFAAERCDDVAVLLTETGTNGAWLPSRETLREAGRIAAGEGATVHVHLPTDGDFDTPQRAKDMEARVRMALERAEPLKAHSFVLHVDVPSLCGTGTAPDTERLAWIREALERIAALTDAPERIAVENLEGFAPTFWDHWLETVPCSRCLDVGHIWKDGGDPVPVLETWLERVRVIHLHGLELREGRVRDHLSLRNMAQERIDAVMHPLWKRGFSGVLTLEVFTAEAFRESYARLLVSYEHFVRISAAESLAKPLFPRKGQGSDQ